MNTVKQFLLAAGLAFASGGAALAQEAAGKWTGVIKVPGAELPIIVTVAKAADGSLSGGLESPSQAPGMVIPIDPIKADDKLFSFTIAAIDGDFMGVW